MDLAKDVTRETDHMVSVYFSCLRCGRIEEIKVHRWRELPRKVYWDCHVCLSEERRSMMRPVV